MATSVLAVLMILIGLALSKRRYIDLTHPITDQIVTFPGMPEYNFTNLVATDENGFWLEYGKFQISEHSGTHMDSPAHFIRNGKYLDEIPLENLVGPGVVIDITKRAALDRIASVQVSDLENWENKYGQIPKGAFVFMNSGWAKKYPNTTDIFGVNVKTANFNEFRFPAFNPAAAEWLLKNRNINGLGTDTPSPDTFTELTFAVHLSILGANRVIMENVANLHNIPQAGTIIYALPISLQKGTGGPMRLVAVLGEGNDHTYNTVQNIHPPFIGTIVSTMLAVLLVTLSL